VNVHKSDETIQNQAKLISTKIQNFISVFKYLRQIVAMVIVTTWYF